MFNFAYFVIAMLASATGLVLLFVILPYYLPRSLAAAEKIVGALFFVGLAAGLYLDFTHPLPVAPDVQQSAR